MQTARRLYIGPQGNDVCVEFGGNPAFIRSCPLPSQMLLSWCGSMGLPSGHGTNILPCLHSFTCMQDKPHYQGLFMRTSQVMGATCPYHNLIHGVRQWVKHSRPTQLQPAWSSCWGHECEKQPGARKESQSASTKTLPGIVAEGKLCSFTRIWMNKPHTTEDLRIYVAA